MASAAKKGRGCVLAELSIGVVRLIGVVFKSLVSEDPVIWKLIC